MTSDLPPNGGPTPGEGAAPGASSGTDAPPPPPPAQPGPAPRPGPPGTQFFDSIRRVGIYRPDHGRWFSGVAAGIARRWGVDPVLVRGGFVALCLIGGAGLLIYGLAWLFLPQDDGRIHAQQVLAGDVSAGFFGGLVFTVLGAGGPSPWGHGGWGFPGGLVLAALIVAGIVLWSQRRPGSGQGAPPPYGPPPGTPGPYPTQYPSQYPTGQPYGPPRPYESSQPYRPAEGPPGETRSEAPPAPYGAYAPPTYTPPQPPPGAWGTPPPGSNPGGFPHAGEPGPNKRALSAPSKRITRATLGLAILAAVAGFLLAGLGDLNTDGQVLVGMTALLGVLALGVIVSGLLGRRAAGLAALGTVLAIVLAGGTAAYTEGFDRGQNFLVAGERTWEPITTDAANQGVSQGVGQLTVDLTDPALYSDPDGRITVPVRMGAGQIIVELPDSVPAEVHVEQGDGDVVEPDGTRHDLNDDERATYRVGPDGDPMVRVNVRQGGGEVLLRTRPLDGATAVTPSPSASPSPTGGN